jgi:hypothetical protein
MDLFQTSDPGKTIKGEKRMSKAGGGKKSLALVVLIVAFISVTPAYSDVIYSSYGPSNAYDTSNAFAITTSQWWGFSFTPDVSARLDSITVTAYSAASGTSFTMLLMDSKNGLPKFTKQGSFSTLFNTSPLTFDTLLSNIILEQGTQYWLVMEELIGGTLYWPYGQDQPAQITARGDAKFNDKYNLFEVTWGGVTSTHVGAFRVEGTPLNAIPEPGMLWLLGCGLLGLIGIGRKMNKQNQGVHRLK